MSRRTTTALLLVLTAAVLLLAGPPGDAAAHPAAPRARLGPSSTASLPVTVSVAGPRSGVRVPPGFLGLGWEYGSLVSLVGPDPARPRPAFIRLLRRLTAIDGPMQLRIGGASQDRTWWSGALRPPPRGTWHVETPQQLAVLAAVLHATGMRALVGLNLLADRPAEARRFADAATRELPRNSIAGFEIGNEADCYSWAARRVPGGTSLSRPATYGLAAYLADLHRYVRALRSDPRVTAPLDGPAACGTEWANPPDAARIAAALGRSTTLTYHDYPLSRCAPADSWFHPSITRLLAPTRMQWLIGRLAGAVAGARRADVPIRIGEANSVGCSGAPGVSNTDAAALWTVDFLFHALAAGFRGVNLHNTTSAAYSVALPSASGLRVMPPYDGLLLFDEAAPPGSRLERVHVSNGALWAWATTDLLGTTRVTMIDPGPRPVVARLQPAGIGAAGLATVTSLTAPSLRSTTGLRLEGLTYDGSHGGDPLGVPDVMTVPDLGGSLDVTVPAHSATLVTYPATTTLASLGR